jgi:membrane protein
MTKLRWIAVLTSLGVTLGYGLERSRGRGNGSDAAARGRSAQSPWRMPWLGWRDVLARTWSETWNDRLLSVAASVAFFILLAIVPGLSVLFSIYGLLAASTLQPHQVASFIGVLPDGAQQLILEQAQRLSLQPLGKLSWNLLLSLAVAGWSANAAVKGLFDGLNVIYDETEKRSFFRLHAVTLLSTVGAIVVLVAAIAIIAAAPGILRELPLGQAVELGARWLRWPLFYVVGALAIALLYWIGPSRIQPRLIWVLPGAFLAALAWGLMSAGFSWYVARLGNYSAMYGSLATVIIFMTWLWLSAAVVLIGAELNAELEHQTEQDTTIGPPKPIGARGAVVADNIGPAVVRERS